MQCDRVSETGFRVVLRARTAGAYRTQSIFTAAVDAFAPYGEVFTARDDPPDFVGIESVGWRSSFICRSEPEVMFYRSRYSSLSFSTLERHFDVSQTFIPLGRVPAVIAVASPREDREFPEPEDVRAFLLDGSAGYLLRPAVWHAPDRYPLYPPHSDVVIITDRETQRELETQERTEWRRTEMIDYMELRDIAFAFEL